jgi:hypothetical protein
VIEYLRVFLVILSLVLIAYSVGYHAEPQLHRCLRPCWPHRFAMVGAWTLFLILLDSAMTRLWG